MGRRIANQFPPRWEVGIVLAAGAGSRMGKPKALVVDDRGPWLARAVQLLSAGGCAEVISVLGAASDEARQFAAGSTVVIAEDWSSGMSASLRAGLSAAKDAGADRAVITLVDLPDLVPEVVARLLAGEARVARAAYRGEPGHPVLIGREHWAEVIDTAVGDAGARGFLSVAVPRLVEMGDLATGRDVDSRADE